MLSSVYALTLNLTLILEIMFCLTVLIIRYTNPCPIRTCGTRNGSTEVKIKKKKKEKNNTQPLQLTLHAHL